MSKLMMQKTFLFAILVVSSLWASVIVVAAAEPTASCLRGDVLISEIDYDQPGVDNIEFVELYGRPNASLNGYEMRFINSSGTIYNTISLDGTNIMSSGYFVIGNDDLFNDPQIYLNDNMIDNNKAAVALYDVVNSEYCNAINYEGTVGGFSDWFNIGFDSEIHGEGRGCARAASGWWSCNRPTTPGGSNGVVAVTLTANAAATTSAATILILFVLCLVATTKLMCRR